MRGDDDPVYADPMRARSRAAAATTGAATGAAHPVASVNALGTAAVLRPWRLDDAASLQTAFTSSNDLASQVGAIELTTLPRCERFIAEHLSPTTVSRRNFAISLDGVAVGNVGVGSMEHRHGTGWVYYWVATAARDRGVATVALASIADWAFSEQGLYRLELGHRTNNEASCRVAQKAGFAIEGIERQKLKYGTERFDVETHARLRSDARPAGRILPIRTR